MDIDRNGIIYFMKIISNDKEIPYIPLEIREIIWYKCYTFPYISCNICNKVLLNFNIFILENVNTENFSIINGIANCWDCRYMNEIMY